MSTYTFLCLNIKGVNKDPLTEDSDNTFVRQKEENEKSREREKSWLIFTPP